MEWLIGLDGGGTKTLAALCDETGHILAFAKGEATNPSSVPRDIWEQRLAELLDALTKGIGGRQAAIAGCFGGFGGGGIPGNQQLMHECFRCLLPNAKAIVNGSDSISALTSEIGVGDGIVAIAGTGSGVYARVQGVMRQTGGWGYLLGDEGSGYDLGRRALTAALRAIDGRGAPTLLTGMCEAKLGETLVNAVARIYKEGRVLIASFATVLLEAQAQGDEVACAQAEEAAWAMCEAIEVAGRALKLPVKPVVLAGSVWQPGGFMETRVQALLGDSFRLIRSSLPPVYGSIVEAASLAGISADQAFEAKFRMDWIERWAPGG